MDLSVIIVNYNVQEELEQCLRSVLKQRGLEFEVIVVDNHSDAESFSRLIQFQSSLKVIKNSSNVGFGAGNNIGFEHAVGDYIYLMNPDAYFKDVCALKKLVAFARANPSCGLIGSRILNQHGESETFPRTTYPGEKEIGMPFGSLPGDIAWVLGASMLIPRDIYVQLQGFDEDFFLYGEDPDICLRVRKLGLKIGYCKTVILYHIGAVTERTISWYDRTMKKENALYLFYQKHYSEEAVHFLLLHHLRRARLKVFLNRLKTLLSFGLLKRTKDQKQQAIYDFCREKLV